MAKNVEPRRRRTAASAGRPAPPQSRGLAWPLWAAAVLVALYLAAHASMVPDSLSLWGGLLSALVTGR